MTKSAKIALLVLLRKPRGLLCLPMPRVRAGKWVKFLQFRIIDSFHVRSSDAFELEIGWWFVLEGRFPAGLMDVPQIGSEVQIVSPLAGGFRTRLSAFEIRYEAAACRFEADASDIPRGSILIIEEHNSSQSSAD